MENISPALKYYYANKQKCNERRRKLHALKKDYETEYRRKYRLTEKGKAATLRAIKNYESKNKVKKQNWGKAQKINKMPCIICGKSPTHRHHPDDNKPLEVIFLCPLHHKQLHIKEKGL